MAPNGRTDAELVGDTLAGNREAFGAIVGRYQTLICSLAYSATGDLARSEDLAQDTFLAVWRQLPGLREPEKLRAWICGIARNRIHDSLRGQKREPVFRAETLEHADEAPAPEALPSDQAVRQDEAAIMWRALERIPEIYREPLILFHRESQSVERVAAVLDLSEDAVKQRLVRGRKLLQAEVESVVEGALRRTAPGREFTSSVMEAVPVSAALAKAGVGAAAAKGFFGGGALGLFTMIMASPVAPLSVVFLERKLGLAAEAGALSTEERELSKRQRRLSAVAILGSAVILQVFGSWFKHLGRPPWFGPLIPLVTVVPMLTFVYVSALRTRWRIWDLWARAGALAAKRKWEYCSRRTLWGLPLFHIRLQASTRPVKAWVAVGNVAYGGIFACGTVTIAPVCLGVFGIGLASIGLCVAGGLALGVQALGILAFGAVAVGWMASGVFAFGLYAAYGLEAYARIFAGCPTGLKRTMAFALHANDPAAGEYFSQSAFFTWAKNCARFAEDFRFWFIGLGAAYFLGWIFWAIIRLRRADRVRENQRAAV